MSFAVDSAYVPDLEDHPAYVAWLRIEPKSPSPLGIVALKPSDVMTSAAAKRRIRSGKTSVYRLHGVSEAGGSIIAKLAPESVVSLEREIYQDILSELPLESVRVLGVLTASAEPLMSWLFLSDEGDEEWNDANSSDQLLYAFSIAQIHGFTCSHRSGPNFPPRDAGYYLSRIFETRQRLSTALGVAFCTPSQRGALTEVDRQLNRIERGWSNVEEVTESVPHSLVHGDLQAKNLRIRSTGGTRALVVLDWEMAGFGLPAADLDQACLREQPTVRARYREAINDWIPGLTDQDVLLMIQCGKVFQLLSAIEWASQSLEWQSHFDRAVRNLDVYSSMLAENTKHSGSLMLFNLH